MTRSWLFTMALMSLVAMPRGSSLEAAPERATLNGHAGAVLQVAFSPDGEPLWDVRTGEVKMTLTGHRAEVDAVVFSPDGKLVASASSIVRQFGSLGPDQPHFGSGKRSAASPIESR